MAKRLFTAKGDPVEIGRELGRGGEGSVFSTPSRSTQVAKIYHKVPDAKKQAKLSFMAETADQQLLNYVAWPQETLHSSPGGTVVGFLMPIVANKIPIHMLYSPAHRQQKYPKIAWNFLLYVARNIASSFETLHNHGHVIGDVNQNSVMVGEDSKTVLIDSDSFQVNARGSLHLCEVGVSHFTPPELQALTSFQGFTRTTNHDNFGLALLIFHILFGGRHPYSGVPLKDGIGDALETDIKNFRYAYARDNHLRGIGPPPRSIPVSMLPAKLEGMFHLAFTEHGAQAARPSASQWVTALDSVRLSLKKCSASTMHIYPNHLGECPWCALEKQGVTYFIDLGAIYTPTSTGFILKQVWARIEAVPLPPTLSIPNLTSFTVTAQPLPANVRRGTIFFCRLLAILSAICLYFFIASAKPKAIPLSIIIGVIGWVGASRIGLSDREAEKMRRKSILNKIKQSHEQLIKLAQNNDRSKYFNTKRTELTKLRDEYQALPQAEKLELDNLHLTAHERQKQRFLDSIFIDSATISGVGPARKAALRSFGIETAADITRARVIQVRGFGENLTRTMLDWRTRHELQFVFNAASAVSVNDQNAIKAKFSARRNAIEIALIRGISELQSHNQRITHEIIKLQIRLEESAKSLAQAEKDLSIF